MNRTRELDNMHNWAKRIREQNESLGGLIEAFEPLFAELLETQNSLQNEDVKLMKADTDKLTRGIPQFVDAPMGDYAQDFLRSARRLLPVMAQSFPGVSDELRKMMYALEAGTADSASLMEAVIHGDEMSLKKMAKKLDISAPCLILGSALALRPVLQVAADSIQETASLRVWGKGYCPVCGGLPSLAILRKSGDDNEYLKSHGGQRWLHCSRCATQWRFKRHMCPHCENEEHDTMEYFSADGKTNERADLCRKCGHYLVTYDAKDAHEEPCPDITILGLLPLDIVMQRDGFSPVAETAWNRLDP